MTSANHNSSSASSWLDFSDGKVVERFENESTLIQVREKGNLRWMDFGNEAVQSCMNLANRSALVLPYTQMMPLALLLNVETRSVLNLGLGGGALHRYLQNLNHPTLRVQSVENNESVIELAKQYFGININDTITHAAADEFVRDTTQIFDVIFCDLCNHSGMPDLIRSAQFYQHCYQRLPDSGVLAINLLSTDKSEMLDILASIRQWFPTGYLLAVPDHKNTLVFAQKQQGSTREGLVTRANTSMPRLGLNLLTAIEALVELPRKANTKGIA